MGSDSDCVQQGVGCVLFKPGKARVGDFGTPWFAGAQWILALSVLGVVSIFSGDASAQTDVAGEDAAVSPITRSAAASIVDTIPVAPTSEDRSPSPRRTGSVGVAIEEIIVTAQKREERASDVPISISAFSGDALEALGVTDTRDLARLVPGFGAAESGGNTTIYTLRGVGFNDATYTATGTVGTYVDEVNLHRELCQWTGHR